MKNEYKIVENHVEVYIKHAGRKIMLVSLEDLPKLISYPLTIGAFYNHCTNSYYAQVSLNADGKPSAARGSTHSSFTRWLLNPPDHLKVDHENHNTLDNRRSNLRLLTHSDNLRNRKRYKSPDYTPFHVNYNKEGRKWRVIQYISGPPKKQVHIAAFKTEEEAKERAVLETLRLKKVA